MLVFSTPPDFSPPVSGVLPRGSTALYLLVYVQLTEICYIDTPYHLERLIYC